MSRQLLAMVDGEDVGADGEGPSSPRRSQVDVHQHGRRDTYSQRDRAARLCTVIELYKYYKYKYYNNNNNICI